MNLLDQGLALQAASIGKGPLAQKPLRDLPNIEGYRFVGVDLDGHEHACIVVKDAVGCHTVKRIADMEPFFFRLYSWRKVAPADLIPANEPEAASHRPPLEKVCPSCGSKHTEYFQVCVSCSQKD